MESRGKIYIADPDAGVVRFVRSAVEPLGYKVQEAMDWGQIGQEARLFGARIVLLSTEIPGVYFGDLIRQVRADPGTKDLPLLTLVAAGDPRAIRDSLEQGADDFVLKPIVIADVVNKLKIHTRPVTAAPGPAPARVSTVDASRELQALSDIADGVASSMAPEDLFYVLVKRAATLIPCERAQLLLKGTVDDEVFAVASSDKPDVRHVKVDLRHHPTWRKALEGHEPQLLDGDGSDWLVPLVVREATVGLLVFDRCRVPAGEKAAVRNNMRLLARVLANLAAAVIRASDALETVKVRSVEEKAPAEEFDNIVLDLGDQIETLIEELESK